MHRLRSSPLPAYSENPDYYDNLRADLVRGIIRSQSERGDVRTEALLVRALSAITRLMDYTQPVSPADKNPLQPIQVR